MPNGIQITKYDTRILDQLIRDQPAQKRRIVGGAAQEITNDIVLQINEQTPGAKQVRYQPRRTVTVSPPGSPPNTDTGALAGSIHWEWTGDAEATLMDGVEYGAYLEFIWNRPVWVPTFARWQNGEFRQFIVDIGILPR